MRIEAYEFGRITADGESYTKDVVIGPGGVFTPWWRREGHRLDVADLAPVLEAGPDTVVVGTGFYGNMRVPEATLDHLRDQDIEVRVAETGAAVALFNDLAAEPARKVVAAFHLTC
jgi:hypothetical protein